jgi:hypothetical protein
MEMRQRVSPSAATSSKRGAFSLCLIDVDRESLGSCISINETEQSQRVHGHGVAKHQKVRVVEEVWDEEKARCERKKEREKMQEGVGLKGKVRRNERA